MRKCVEISGKGSIKKLNLRLNCIKVLYHRPVPHSKASQDITKILALGLVVLLSASFSKDQSSTVSDFFRTC